MPEAFLGGGRGREVQPFSDCKINAIPTLLHAVCLPRKVGALFHTQSLTAACAAGVVTRTVDRDSSRYRYSGNRRTRQLALDCEGN